MCVQDFGDLVADIDLQQVTSDLSDAAAAGVQPPQHSSASSAAASLITTDDAALPVLCVDVSTSVSLLSTELNYHHPGLSKQRYFGESPTKRKRCGNIPEIPPSKPLLSELDLHTVDAASVGWLSTKVTHHHPAKRKCLHESSTKQTSLRNVSKTCPFDSTAAELVSVVDARHAQYLERRRKNNVASKRSRETRKLELKAMEAEAERLEQVKARLRRRVSELEAATQSMKSALINALRHD